jgi:hypothetical protein
MWATDGQPYWLDAVNHLRGDAVDDPQPQTVPGGGDGSKPDLGNRSFAAPQFGGRIGQGRSAKTCGCLGAECGAL